MTREKDHEQKSGSRREDSRFTFLAAFLGITAALIAVVTSDPEISLGSLAVAGIIATIFDKRTRMLVLSCPRSRVLGGFVAPLALGAFVSAAGMPGSFDAHRVPEGRDRDVTVPRRRPLQERTTLNSFRWERKDAIGGTIDTTDPRCLGNRRVEVATRSSADAAVVWTDEKGKWIVRHLPRSGRRLTVSVSPRLLEQGNALISCEPVATTVSRPRPRPKANDPAQDVDPGIPTGPALPTTPPTFVPPPAPPPPSTPEPTRPPVPTPVPPTPEPVT